MREKPPAKRGGFTAKAVTLNLFLLDLNKRRVFFLAGRKN